MRSGFPLTELERLCDSASVSVIFRHVGINAHLTGAGEARKQEPHPVIHVLLSGSGRPCIFLPVTIICFLAIRFRIFVQTSFAQWILGHRLPKASDSYGLHIHHTEVVAR